MTPVLISKKTKKKPLHCRNLKMKAHWGHYDEYFGFWLWSPWFLEYMDISQGNKFPGNLHSLRFILTWSKKTKNTGESNWTG